MTFTRRTRGVLTAALLLGSAVAVGSQTRLFGLIGPQQGGTGLTPNHWSLTPVGLSTEIGDRPMGAAMSPDGRYLAVSNDGQGVQSLALFDTATRRVVQSIPYAAPEALYVGVVWSPDGKTLYASAGGNNKVRVYSFDAAAGELTEGPSLVLGDAKATLYPAGLAISRDGRTLYVAENLGNTLSAVDLGSPAAAPVVKTLTFGAPAGDASIGTLPYQLLLSGDGQTLYVSHLNARAVSAVNTADLSIEAKIAVGDHPGGLALSPDHRTLYVANANSDTVSAVNTASNTVTGEVRLAPYAGAPFGSMPDAVTVSPDGRTLYVANAGNNDVAVVDATSLRVRGLLPTAWFPSTLSLNRDGSLLFVGNMKGLGAGPNPQGPVPGKPNPEEQYIASMARGTLQSIALPPATGAGSEELKALTAQVVKNNGFDETQGVLTRTAADTTRHAIPRRPGDPTPIKHVIYVIKENRTYDQVLGDLKAGDGDAGLTLFGPDVTPNQHALASRFGLFDRFYADAEVSADGHNWSMGGVATEYTQKNWPANYSGRNRPYDFEGSSSAPAPSGGYLFDFAARDHVSFRSYGEFADFASKPPNMRPAPFIPVLKGHLSPTFPTFDMSVSDQVRLDAWKTEFDGYVKSGGLPQLSVVRLPRDHTNGTRQGSPTPAAYVADNDLAVGRLVDTVSHSPYWKDTAIFIVEDDAQNGPDHVDAHRTTAYVVSAYNRQNTPDHTSYSTVSLLRTMELILGMAPMTQFDAAATPMVAAFQDTPDLTPYTALTPRQPLDTLNATGAYRQQDAAKMDFSQEDRVNDASFNDMIWHAVKGDTPMPAPRNSFRAAPTLGQGDGDEPGQAKPDSD